MKTQSSRIKVIMILIGFLLPLNLLAQSDVGDLFKSGPADATKLVNAYMNPLFKGLGVGLNSGWHNTAKTKNFLTFDLRVTATAAFVPTKDKTFNVNSLGLQNIKPDVGQTGIGPTAFGDDNEGSIMRLYANGAPTAQTFKLPQGLGFNYVPSPQIQLTVGLPKNIDVSLRYVPEIKIADDYGKIGMFGVGAKIEVLPLLMGKTEKLIPFDLAVAAGFTRLTYSLPLDINNQTNSNQTLDLKINGFNAEAIISKKILFFTPFASVGYGTSTTNLNALGAYTFDSPTQSEPNRKETFTDPVKIKNNTDSFKASLGFQLNLGFLRVYTSYTEAKYSYINAGLGIGLGK